MSGTAINSPRTAGVEVTTAAGLPFVIATTGTIETNDPSAISSTVTALLNPTLPSVLNDGVLAGQSGIVLAAPGSVIWTYGTVTGNSDVGISLRNGGAIQNGPGVGGSPKTPSLIDGRSDGIEILGGSQTSTILNAGNPASILGGNNGVVDGANAAISINNQGTIAGSNGTGVNTLGALTLTNNGNGTISGGANGLNVGGGSIVNNAGVISGTNLAISAAGSITLSNLGVIKGNLQIGTGIITNGAATNTTSTISGSINSSQGTLVNYGTIDGSVANENSVTNGSVSDTSALIAASSVILLPNGTMANYGTLAFTGNGVIAAGGGNISNGSSNDSKATINGANGIDIASGAITNFGTINGAVWDGSGTVSNSGTIEGSLSNGAATLFTMGPGTVINAGVIGSASFRSTNFLQNQSGGVVGANGSASGTIATVANNGTITLSGGFDPLDITSAVDAASDGVFQLAGGRLEVASALGSQIKMQFIAGSTSSVLTIDKSANFGTGIGSSDYKGPLVMGFAKGDTIDLRDVTSNGVTLNYEASTGILQITASGKAATLSFQNSSLGSGSFHAQGDGAGGILITRS
jgi:hypothetical protein